jgi:sulfonate transport system permease protein
MPGGRAQVGRISARLTAPLLGGGFLVAFCLVWQLAKASGHLNFQYLPLPSDVIRASGDLGMNGDLASNFGHTAAVTVAGWLIASTIGVALGVCLGLNNDVWRYSMASFEVLRALPPIAFVPAILLIAGFSSKTELIIVGFGALLPVLVYTIAGVRQVTVMHYQVSGTLHLTRRAILTSIVLPRAANSIVVGLRIALGLSLSLAVVSEMVGNPAGVGNQLIFQQQALNAPNLFVYVVGLGLLGVVLNAVLMLMIRALIPHIVSVGANR